MEESMKIVFVNTTKEWGGGEKWHLENAQALNNRNHSVSLLTNHNSELKKRAQKHQLPCYSVPVSRLSFLNIFKLIYVFFFFRKVHPDAVILNGPNDVKLTAQMAKFAGVKKIIYRRGIGVAIKNKRINRYLLSKVVTHIITNSQSTKNLVLQNLDNILPPNKVTVIYNGFDLLELPQKNIKLNQKKQKIIIGNAGRLSDEKGQDVLIDVALFLNKQNINFEIQIAGEGKLREYLQQKIHKNHLDNHIKLLGFINNIQEFLSQIDIFIFPSQAEGFGFALVEAMAQKLPVVAFNVGSIPEIVIHNKTGYIIEKRNILQMNNALLNLIHSESLRYEMGMNGYNRVMSQFGFDKALNELENLIALDQ